MNTFLKASWTRIFRFPGPRGERKITFYKSHYHEFASFLLSEYPTKIHLKSARHDTKIVQKIIQNRFQGCLEQNFGFSWRRLRIKKPMKPDSSAGGPRGARKTHPLDDQDGGKTVKKSTPKWIKKSRPRVILDCVAPISPYFSPLGSPREPLGASWEPLKSLLGASWDVLGASREAHGHQN